MRRRLKIYAYRFDDYWNSVGGGVLDYYHANMDFLKKDVRDKFTKNFPYIATKPKWFIKRYNPKEMFEVHRIVGIVSVILVCAHWYVYFLKALKSFLGFWGGYISLVAMFIALIFAVLYLTPWVGNMAKSVSRKKAIWIHRLNLVAIIAANIHVHGFGRLSKMVPFLPVFDILTYALVIYYIYWMIKQKQY